MTGLAICLLARVQEKYKTVLLNPFKHFFQQVEVQTSQLTTTQKLWQPIVTTSDAQFRIIVEKTAISDCDLNSIKALDIQKQRLTKQ